MSVAGRWFISPHAVRRYQRRVAPGLSYEQALADLVRLSTDAHHVRTLATGLDLWRGPKPQRLRCYVGQGTGALPVLVTVLAGCD